MEPKDVISIPTMKEFNALLDSLNLSDRQRKIFLLKYSRRLRNIDIAAEIDVSKDTVSDELKVISEKLKTVARENLKRNGVSLIDN